jgi:hypothetical protein
MLDMIEAPEAQTTDLTTLPPADRAALVLNSTKTEADLKQLAESLKAITLVNSPAGREQAHALAMTARTARTTITKVGKAAREDATKFSAAVIAEEKRLIGLISEQEDRVLGLRDAWDSAEAARKEAELQKERDRIAAHQAVIAQIRSYPGLARECRTSATALHILEKLTAIDISGLEEFKEEAAAIKIAADEQINDIIEAKQAAEAEAARIKAEQEAEAARLAAERERLEAERAEAARVQAEQQAELLAMQARMKAQQDELDRQAAAMAQQAAELEARKGMAVEKTVVIEPASTLAQELAQPVANTAGVSLIRGKVGWIDSAVRILADDPREALGQIMPEGLNITAHQPEPVIVQVPATVEQMHDTGNSIMYGQTIPTAVDLANTIAYAQGVPQETAIRWLAHRADEFKTLAESQA